LKKLILSIVIALALVVTFAMPVFAWDSKVVLENKDPGTWEEINGDGIRGVVKFDSSGADFSYGLFAKGLDADTDYSLIYYADPWPGDNPGALITESTTNGKGKIPRWDEGSVDLGMNLPDVNDANYPDGAKLWLVPSTDYDSDTNSMTAWNPEDYLFECNLIRYARPQVDQEELPYMGMEGQFTIEVFTSRYNDSFSWAGGWNELPQILGEPVSITGQKNGTTLTLEIPTGTEVSFPYRPGVLVTYLSVNLVNGEVVFNPKNMDFSQPATLTVNGESITFTEIRDGSPVL